MVPQKSLQDSLLISLSAETAGKPLIFYLSGNSSGAKIRRKREKHRMGKEKKSNASRQEMKNTSLCQDYFRKLHDFVGFCLFVCWMVGVINFLVTLKTIN